MTTAIATRDTNTEAWRLPETPDGHEVLFSEHGRVLDLKAAGGNYDVCYRSYAYTVTAASGGLTHLRVKHGGGEESYRIGYRNDPLVKALGRLDSDARYFILHGIREQATQAARSATDRTELHWRQAAAEKRIRTRKIRGENKVKVWIEPEDKP